MKTGTIQKNKTKTEEKLEEILNGLFLHGKETPEKSYGLPKGQYTVAEAFNLISQERKQWKKESKEELPLIVNRKPFDEKKFVKLAKKVKKTLKEEGKI